MPTFNLTPELPTRPLRPPGGAHAFRPVSPVSVRNLARDFAEVYDFESDTRSVSLGSQSIRSQEESSEGSLRDFVVHGGEVVDWSSPAEERLRQELTRSYRQVVDLCTPPASPSPTNPLPRTPSPGTAVHILPVAKRACVESTRYAVGVYPDESVGVMRTTNVSQALLDGAIVGCHSSSEFHRLDEVQAIVNIMTVCRADSYEISFKAACDMYACEDE